MKTKENTNSQAYSVRGLKANIGIDTAPGSEGCSEEEATKAIAAALVTRLKTTRPNFMDEIKEECPDAESVNALFRAVLGGLMVREVMALEKLLSFRADQAVV